MKRVYLYLAFILLIFNIMFIPSVVFANDLEIDGNMGIILHIEPDDDPSAKEPTALFFQLKDKNNQFKSVDCQCIITIMKNGQIVDQENLFNQVTGDLTNNIQFNYIFPSIGLYQILISGSPSHISEFKSFHILFDIKVSKVSNHPVDPSTDPQAITSLPKNTSSWYLNYSVAILGGSIFLIGLAIFIFKKDSTVVVKPSKK